MHRDDQTGAHDVGDMPPLGLRHPSDSDAAFALRQALVDKLMQQHLIVSSAVESALRAVPRHVFLPETALDRVYADDAVVTKWDELGLPISSASQPAIVAIMLDQLDLAPGMRVLEIGAGTGYNAALLATIVGPSGHITTVDLDSDIADAARAHLAAAGFTERVTVICDDGAEGWPENAPYDRVILTVGAWDVSPAWVAQLTPAGRLVLPLAIHTIQVSVALDRDGDDLISASLRPCGFMRLRGSFAGPETLIAVGSTGRILTEAPAPTPERVNALLATPQRQMSFPQSGADLARYLIAFLGKNVVSYMGTTPHQVLGMGAVGMLTPEGDSACFIVGSSHALFEYGAATAALQVEACFTRWRALGEPPLHQWRLRFTPRGELATPPDARVVTIPKRDWTITLEFQNGATHAMTAP